MSEVGLGPIIPAPEWEVTFKVKFKSDMFPGFGYDPMDIVKALKRDIEKGSVGHYVEGAEWSLGQDWWETSQPAGEDGYRKTNDCPDYLRS